MHSGAHLGLQSVEQAITGRRSVRSFRPDPVPRDLVERMLAQAARAPSGANMQPWKVHVVMGAALKGLTSKMAAHYAGSDKEPEAEYDYYPPAWREPYLARRREVGFALYAALGIQRADRIAMRRQQGRNYTFFGAPVGLIFAIDRDLERGSLLDIGMFMQNLMVLAVANGLGTCPQASLSYYHALIRDELRMSDTEMVLCGLAMGWPDSAAPENVFATTRVPVADFAKFHESNEPWSE